MPFKSEKQRRYLWANEPDVAREFSDKEKRGKSVKTKLDALQKRKKKRGNQWS